MSLNLASTMIALRQTVTPKNYDPDLARDFARVRLLRHALPISFY